METEEDQAGGANPETRRLRGACGPCASAGSGPRPTRRPADARLHAPNTALPDNRRPAAAHAVRGPARVSVQVECDSDDATMYGTAMCN